MAVIVGMSRRSTLTAAAQMFIADGKKARIAHCVLF
jgi:hypothetical protein